jgi:hypothetical protein
MNKMILSLRLIFSRFNSCGIQQQTFTNIVGEKILFAVISMADDQEGATKIGHFKDADYSN